MTSVAPHIWGLTAIGLGAILGIDFLVAFFNRKKPSSLKNAVVWTLIYVVAAIVFGILIRNWVGPTHQKEFFAGWITEYSLSFDNLFVFLLIISRMKIKAELEEMVLYIGIVTSLLLRGIFIAAGSALVNRFSWVFFIFGGFLIYTAIKLFTQSEHDEWNEGKFIGKLRARGASPALLALIAIAITNVLFAFDSIPAIFGLTKSTYIIVTANVFAVMGLRQLYFVIGGLMKKLHYLSEGLSFLLGFIGVKLILEAMIEQGWHRVAGVHIPVISLTVSLGVIIGTLIATAVLSILKSKRS
jgi:tellurite resistance protein TerC